MNELINLTVLYSVLFGIVVGFALFGFIVSLKKQTMLNAFKGCFVFSIFLLAVSIGEPLNAFSWIGHSNQATMIYAGAVLFLLNIITLYRYYYLTKDNSERIIQTLRVTCLLSMLIAISSLFTSPLITYAILILTILLTILSYILYLFEVIEIQGELVILQHTPALTMTITMAYTTFYHSVHEFEFFQLIPDQQYFWLFTPVILVISYYSQQTQIGDFTSSDDSLELLNTELADQNFELQVTLRELKAKNNELEQLSTLDALSGIHNRGHFDKRLQAELRRTRRELLPLSLVMFDIDHFKVVNDTYGHLCGDEVIRSIALLAQESLQRPADAVFRYGGEEFALILPNTDATGAFALADRIREKISKNIVNSQLGEVKCTASFGIGFTDSQQAMSPKEIIGQADNALYQAKSNGRNQVIIFSSKEPQNAT